MAKFLASVMSVEEAQIALDGGADIVDCKDPSTGALGALANDRVAAIVNHTRGRRPVSTTIGDVAMEPFVVRDAVSSRISLGTDYIKIGLLPADGTGECIRALEKYTKLTSLIGVLFADKAPDLEVLSLLADTGFAGVMLDTVDKANGGLRHHASQDFILRFVVQAKSLGLISGLAGSLTLEDVPKLLELDPDYLGFRGVLCKGHRTSAIDANSVATLAKLLHPRTIRAARIGSTHETE
jgi:dihydroneopterin aldolase